MVSKLSAAAMTDLKATTDESPKAIHRP
jgi:hypothetical protein